MEKKKKSKVLVSVVVALILATASLLVFNFDNTSSEIANASTCQVALGGSYQTADNAGYYPSKAQSNSMSFNSSSLGTLKVNGVDAKGTYNGFNAYAISGSSSVSLNYTLKYNKNSINGSSWSLSSDSASSVNGISLNGSSIGKGCVIVEKKNLSESSFKVLSRTANAFNSSNKFELTSLSGTDLSYGCYYRISVAYEIVRSYQQKHKILFVTWYTTEYEYKNCLEVYNIFIARNDCDIQFLDLAEKDYSSYGDEAQIELVKKGDTLQNGSVTSKGFKINYLNNKSYSVSYKRNGGSAVSVKDGQTITQNGKYDITVKSVFGNSKTTTIYVYNGGTDKGYSTYFGNSIFDGKRVADLSQTLPTYQTGVKLKLNGVGTNIPAVRGTIKNMTTGYETKVNASSSANSFALNSEGVYMVSLVNGDENLAGTTYHYDFAFIVSNESSAPSINLNNIVTNFSVQDFDAEHIEVDYKMPSGKIAHICFDKDDYYLAYQLAYTIEKKYITKNNNVYSYNGKKFTDETLLVDEMNKVVLTKLNYRFFTKAQNDFGIDEENMSYSIKLEELNANKDIYVTSTVEFGKLLRKDYILSGNFKFVQAGKYESEKIVAKNLDTGKVTTLAYCKNLSSMLTVSGRYEITETNCYNESIKYTIVYCNSNESKVNLSVNGKNVTVDRNNYQVVNGTNVSIKSITNSLDDDGTVLIADLTSKKVQMLDLQDAQNYEFGKSNYLVSLIDRSGNVFSFVVNTLSTKQTSLKNAINAVKSQNSQIYNYILSYGVSTKSNAYNG